jgi:predicted nuclease with TOPRIM domain
MPDNKALDIISDRLQEMHTDIREARQENQKNMERVTTAIETLAKIEERQSQTNESISELKNSVKSHDDRIDELEKRQPELDRIKTIVWGVTAFVATSIGTLIFANISTIAKFLVGM